MSKKRKKKKYKDAGTLKETAQSTQHTWFGHVNRVEDTIKNNGRKFIAERESEKR
jgi:hypothetical protein